MKHPQIPKPAQSMVSRAGIFSNGFLDLFLFFLWISRFGALGESGINLPGEPAGRIPGEPAEAGSITPSIKTLSKNPSRQA